MDNPTGGTRHPATSTSRWVSADALLRHLEARAGRDHQPYRYISLAPLPGGPPPDPWRIDRRPVWRARRDTTPVKLPPRSRHGTLHAYDRYDCRCQGCTDAAALAQRRVRHRRRERHEQEQEQEQERQQQGSAA